MKHLPCITQYVLGQRLNSIITELSQYILFIARQVFHLYCSDLTSKLVSHPYTNSISEQSGFHFLCIICVSGLPPRQPSGRVLASSAGGPGFNPQSRTASYLRRYKNGTSSTLVQHSTLKREILILALSRELR